MNKSEQINEIAKALVLAQKEMKNATKNAVNPYFKSSYADLTAVLDACLPALNNNGIALSQTTEVGPDRTYLVTSLIHTSGQWISGSLPLNPVKNDPQGMGSAISYAKRYGLQAIVGIASEDDDGNAATKPKPQETDFNYGANVGLNPTTHEEEYVVPFGKKYRGKTLNEMGPDDVRSFAEFLQNASAKEGKPLSKQGSEFVEKAESYLRNNQDLRM